MTITQEPSLSGTPASSNETFSPIPRRSLFGRVFVGQAGIRSGWRLTLFIALITGIGAGTQHLINRIPGVWNAAHSPGTGELSMFGRLLAEGMLVFSLFLAAGIMATIEKRSFSAYGLPGNKAFGTRFWQGIVLGFAMITVLLAMIAALHGFSFGSLSATGAQAAKFGALYGLLFILAGIFEEFSFRGYMQSTLASGVGFWPAAILLSALFGAAHTGNPREGWAGGLSAAGLGIVAAFSLARTGTIWLAIGMHAAFDWGETFFYAVPNSGFQGEGHLLNSAFHGPRWLTGGGIGPEGSVFVFLVLALTFAAIHFMFPRRQPA